MIIVIAVIVCVVYIYNIYGKWLSNAFAKANFKIPLARFCPTFS